MADSFIAACVQNNASSDVDYNLETCLRLSKQAAQDGAQLIARNCSPLDGDWDYGVASQAYFDGV